MRRWLLAVMLTSGCFSETSDPVECRAGRPGCDCTPAGSCNEGLECVASIDKCVPTDCTPGARTCTCADGMLCLGELTCQDGVCLDPSPSTTGDPTVASSGVVTTTSATESTATPPDTASTGPQPTSADDANATSDPGSSGGSTVACPGCIAQAAATECVTQREECDADDAQGGCKSLYGCVVQEQGSFEACCAENDATADSHTLWVLLADCAWGSVCEMQCALVCPAG